MFLKDVRQQSSHDHQRTKQVLIKNILSLWVHQSHSDMSQLTQSSYVSLYVRYLRYASAPYSKPF